MLVGVKSWLKNNAIQWASLRDEAARLDTTKFNSIPNAGYKMQTTELHGIEETQSCTEFLLHGNL